MGTGLALAGLGFIAVATLTGSADSGRLARLTSLWCLVCGDEGGADVAANLLLFLPFAIGLRLSGVSWLRTVMVAAAVSFTVELLQFTVVTGRDASLSDLLTNTTSGAIGAAVAPSLPGMASPGPRYAAALLAGGSAAWLAVLSISAWLVAPGIPGGRLVSWWATGGDSSGDFGGRVRSVHFGGVALPENGPPPDPAALRRQLERDTFSLRADVLSGKAAPDRRWIYVLQAGSARALALYQLGRRAGVVMHVRGLRFKLRPVTLTLADGLPALPGVPVRLETTGRGRSLSLASTYTGFQRSIELDISPALGWILLAPADLMAGSRIRWITAGCLAATLLVLGYWGGRSGRPKEAVVLLAAVLAGGLAAIPALAGFPPVHWSEWLAGAAGAAAGWALGRPAAYLERRCASPSASESSSS